MLAIGLIVIATAAVVAMICIKHYDNIIDELTARIAARELDLKNQFNIACDLRDEVQIESVKAAYAHNQFEKLEQDVLFAQATLIDTEIKLNKMTAEYLELQNVFAETMVAEAIQIEDLMESLNDAEYVHPPVNYKAGW